MMGDNYWPYRIDRSKARDVHLLAEAASVDAMPFNHPVFDTASAPENTNAFLGPR